MIKPPRSLAVVLFLYRNSHTPGVWLDNSSCVKALLVEWSSSWLLKAWKVLYIRRAGAVYLALLYGNGHIARQHALYLALYLQQ